MKAGGGTPGMNMHHLRVFFHVADLGSFSRAAERLGVSQPNVSTQVRRLEEELALPLVEQGGRGLHLTHAGAVLLGYARRILQLEREAEQTLADLQSLRTGLVSLGASTVPGAYLLPPALAALRQRYPGVQAQVQIANSGAVAARVLGGDLDFAILGPDAGSLPQLVLAPLCRDRLVIVADPEHPLATSGDPVTPAMLAEYPFVVREPGSSTRQVLLDRLAAAKATVRPALEVGSNEALKESVAAGLGLGAISRLAVTWELKTGRLREVPLAGLELGRTFCVARHRDRRLSKAGQALLDALHGEVARLGLPV